MRSFPRLTCEAKRIGRSKHDRLFGVNLLVFSVLQHDLPAIVPHSVEFWVHVQDLSDEVQIFCCCSLFGSLLSPLS